MNSGPVTLTREEWSAIWDGLDQLRDRHDRLYEVTSALNALGLHKPADLIDDVHEDNVAETIRLQGILVNADNGWTAPAKIRLFSKWLWPLNNPNKEA